MVKARLNKNINISNVIKKVAYTVLSLYVGGFIITVLGNVMNGTCSPFYDGLKLVGWTVASGTCRQLNTFNDHTITTTSGVSILAVIGLVGMSSIVLEFVSFSW